VQRIAKVEMSGRLSEGQSGVKRQREQEEEGKETEHVEEDEDEEEEVEEEMEHPLILLELVMANFDTLVWLQLCNPQGVSLFSFVRLPPRVPRPFAGAAVYDTSLTHAERLCAVGCGLKGRLVRLLSLCVGRHFEPQRNWRACHQMMQSIARRVASKLMAAVRDEAVIEAARLCASGQSGAALVPLQRAIDFGDFSSLLLMTSLLIDGKEGVAQDRDRGFQLLEEGARLDSEVCQLMLQFVLALRKLQTDLKHCLDSSLSPDPQLMALLLQYQQLLPKLQAAWKQCVGASMPLALFSVEEIP